MSKVFQVCIKLFCSLLSAQSAGHIVVVIPFRLVGKNTYWRPQTIRRPPTPPTIPRELPNTLTWSTSAPAAQATSTVIGNQVAG